MATARLKRMTVCDSLQGPLNVHRLNGAVLIQPLPSAQSQQQGLLCALLSVHCPRESRRQLQQPPVQSAVQSVLKGGTLQGRGSCWSASEVSCPFQAELCWPSHHQSRILQIPAGSTRPPGLGHSLAWCRVSVYGGLSCAVTEAAAGDWAPVPGLPGATLSSDHGDFLPHAVVL